jgi:hypothetical protein
MALGQIILNRLGKSRQQLTEALQDTDVPLGVLAQRIPDLADRIAAHDDADALLVARNRARDGQDLYWALHCARRLQALSADSDYGIELVQMLGWAQHWDEADRVLRGVRPDRGLEPLYLRTACEVDIGLGRFESARTRIAEIETTHPARAQALLARLIRALAARGAYAEARQLGADAGARFPGNAELAEARIRLSMLFDGPMSALKSLAAQTDVLPADTDLAIGLKAELLSEAGRHNDALDHLLVTAEHWERRGLFMGLLTGAAQHCDRVREVEVFLDRAHGRHGDLRPIIEARCNLAIDQSRSAEVPDLMTRLRAISLWSWRSAELAEACQSSDSASAHAVFDRMLVEGLRFVGPRIHYALYLYYFRSSHGGVAKASAIVSELIDSHRDQSGLMALHLKLLIAKDRDVLAQTFYQSLPKGQREGAELAPFGAYFLARAGEHRAAQTAWTQHLASSAHLSLNARSAYPTEVKLRFAPKSRDDILLFLTVFNGVEYLDWFLAYYRDLGVDHFFVVDNGSDDGTFERLLDEPDVSVFRQTGSFAASACGVFWANHLMRRFGVGHWCLHVDMDEALVFPLSDKGRSLRDLLRYLDAQGYATVAGIMLDIYPEQLGAEEGRDPFAASCFIDTDYVFTRNEIPPYTFVQGGVRARLTGRSLLMTKAPLLRMDAETAYVANNHQHTHLPVADVSVALLHYKFIGDISGRVDEAIDREEHFLGARFYRALREGLTRAAIEGSLIGSSSVRYSGTSQLVLSNLIHSSPGWENTR